MGTWHYLLVLSVYNCTNIDLLQAAVLHKLWLRGVNIHLCVRKFLRYFLRANEPERDVPICIHMLPQNIYLQYFGCVKLFPCRSYAVYVSVCSLEYKHTLYFAVIMGGRTPRFDVHVCIPSQGVLCQ